VAGFLHQAFHHPDARRQCRFRTGCSVPESPVACCRPRSGFPPDGIPSGRRFPVSSAPPFASSLPSAPSVALAGCRRSHALSLPLCSTSCRRCLGTGRPYMRQPQAVTLAGRRCRRRRLPACSKLRSQRARVPNRRCLRSAPWHTRRLCRSDRKGSPRSGRSSRARGARTRDQEAEYRRDRGNHRPPRTVDSESESMAECSYPRDPLYSRPRLLPL
jgi:hypothetical protein